MKNILFVLLLLIGISTLNSSCKKDSKDNALLTSGKWYYSYNKIIHTAAERDCFNENDYFEFRTDGTVTASNLGDGTYTLTEDGKGFSMTLNSNLKTEYKQWQGTITTLRKGYMQLRILAVRELKQDHGYEITLGNKHSGCYIK